MANRLKSRTNKVNKLEVPPKRKPQFRFGIGEWYGKSFADLTGKQRRKYAQIQLLPKEDRPKQVCPFLSRPGKPINCHKDGGICSLRSYERSPLTGVVTVDSRRSPLITTCPSRFEQDSTIYRWISEVILEDQNAVPIGETPFLRRTPRLIDAAKTVRREVGRMDNVLIVPNTDSLKWCPVEKQAVYFSGKEMLLEFQAMAQSNEDAIPFPREHRRPDYRSCAAKRLLPQLETKVPPLSMWAKKMAVVVDEEFFAQFATMKEEEHVSLAEILWFVVKYEKEGGSFVLRAKSVHMTKLLTSIVGIIAATPIPLPEFENAIKGRIKGKIFGQN
jgi:hypothetical protein